jgi:hypothetical protein
MIDASAAVDTPWLHRQLRRLREFWWLPLLGLFSGFVLAIMFLRNTEYVYAAELKVYPAATASGVRPPSALGGLAALAGLGSGGSDTVPPFRYFIEGVYAPEVAARLARDPALMHIVFAGQWDARSGTWHAPSAGLIGGALASLNSALGRPTTPWRAPDAEALQRYIADSVLVQQSMLSPLTTLRFNHRDPVFAARFLGAVTITTDRWLREQQGQRTAENIAFLSGQLLRTVQTDQREALVLALAEQEQRGMFSAGDTPYAAERFDAVQVSPGPAKPRVVALAIGASIAGLGLGLMLALLPLRAWLRRGRAPDHNSRS